MSYSFICLVSVVLIMRSLPNFPPQPKSLWIYSSTSDILPTSSLCTDFPTALGAATRGQVPCSPGHGWHSESPSPHPRLTSASLSYWLALLPGSHMFLSLVFSNTFPLLHLVSILRKGTCKVKYWNSKYLKKIPWRRACQPTPVFLPGEFYGQRIWWATVHGVSKSWTWLSD